MLRKRQTDDHRTSSLTLVTIPFDEGHGSGRSVSWHVRCRTLPRSIRRSTDHPLRNGTADRCVSTCHGLALANKVLGAESYRLLRRVIEKRISSLILFALLSDLFPFFYLELTKALRPGSPMIYQIKSDAFAVDQSDFLVALRNPSRAVGAFVASFSRFRQSRCVSSRHAVSYYFRSRSLRSGTVGARDRATVEAGRSAARVRGPRDERSPRSSTRRTTTSAKKLSLFPPGKSFFICRGVGPRAGRPDAEARM